MKRKIITIILLITIIFSMTACSKAIKPTRYQAQFLELFDTVTTVIGYSEDKAAFSEFAQSVYDNLEVYHKLYDKYHSYEGINNIKTINDNAGISPVKVDQKIIDMLLFAQEAYDLTDGKVNIAFGAVLTVWHDYRTEGTEDPTAAKLPPMELLNEKANHTDINKVIINETESTVYLEDPAMSLDVGAIAKGYATEQVTQILAAEGYTNALLSVGGNVRSIGSKGYSITTDPGNEDNNTGNSAIGADKAWNVGIQNPYLEKEELYLDILNLQNLSLVSSGDYERYYTVDGVEYHHIIDPITLMPAEYFKAVSIVTANSGLADALSTAIFNMTYEEGLQLIEDLPDTEALWAYDDGEKKYSSGFEAMIKKDNKDSAE